MPLGIKCLFQRLFGRDNTFSPDDPVSIILLYRHAAFLTLEQLRAAGERAFGGDKNVEYSIAGNAAITLMKAGPHVFSFLNSSKPYGDGEFAQEFERALPADEQRRAWQSHRAWTAVDYVKGGTNVKLEHALLAKLCRELLGDDVACVYIPREQMLVPNNGAIEKALKKLERKA